MNLKERFTLLGVAMRLLATLRQLTRAQERIAKTGELALKLELLARNATIEQLEAAEVDQGEGQAEVMSQSPEELFLIKQIQEEAERRGIKLDERDDPIEIFQELGYIPKQAPKEQE